MSLETAWRDKRLFIQDHHYRYHEIKNANDVMYPHDHILMSTIPSKDMSFYHVNTVFS